MEDFVADADAPVFECFAWAGTMPCVMRFRQEQGGAAGGIAPTLRKEREEWGTHGLG